MSEWISVNDKLPNQNIDVLVLVEGGRKGIVIIARYWDVTGQWLHCDPRGEFDNHVTHWAKLPELIKANNND